MIAVAVDVALASCEIATTMPSASAPRLTASEWDLTRPPPPLDNTTADEIAADERKEPGHDHQPEHR